MKKATNASKLYRFNLDLIDNFYKNSVARNENDTKTLQSRRKYFSQWQSEREDKTENLVARYRVKALSEHEKISDNSSSLNVIDYMLAQETEYLDNYDLTVNEFFNEKEKVKSASLLQMLKTFSGQDPYVFFFVLESTHSFPKILEYIFAKFTTETSEPQLEIEAVIEKKRRSVKWTRNINQTISCRVEQLIYAVGRRGSTNTNQYAKMYGLKPENKFQKFLGSSEKIWQLIQNNDLLGSDLYPMAKISINLEIKIDEKLTISWINFETEIYTHQLSFPAMFLQSQETGSQKELQTLSFDDYKPSYKAKAEDLQANIKKITFQYKKFKNLKIVNSAIPNIYQLEAIRHFDELPKGEFRNWQVNINSKVNGTSSNTFQCETAIDVELNRDNVSITNKNGQTLKISNLIGTDQGFIDSEKTKQNIKNFLETDQYSQLLLSIAGPFVTNLAIQEINSRDWSHLLDSPVLRGIQGYNLILKSENKPPQTQNLSENEVILTQYNGVFSLWGMLNGKCKLTEMGKDLKLPSTWPPITEWKNNKTVFIDPASEIFNILKKGHDRTPKIKFCIEDADWEVIWKVLPGKNPNSNSEVGQLVYEIKLSFARVELDGQKHKLQESKKPYEMVKWDQPLAERKISYNYGVMEYQGVIYVLLKFNDIPDSQHLKKEYKQYQIIELNENDFVICRNQKQYSGKETKHQNIPVEIWSQHSYAIKECPPGQKRKQMELVLDDYIKKDEYLPIISCYVMCEIDHLARNVFPFKVTPCICNITSFYDNALEKFDDEMALMDAFLPPKLKLGEQQAFGSKTVPAQLIQKLNMFEQNHVIKTDRLVNNTDLMNKKEDLKSRFTFSFNNEEHNKRNTINSENGDNTQEIPKFIVNNSN